MLAGTIEGTGLRVLTPAGVTALLGAKLATDGGEGWDEGKLGLKKEKNAFSVASGASKKTWDYMKGIIDSIEIIADPTK